MLTTIQISMICADPAPKYEQHALVNPFVVDDKSTFRNMHHYLMTRVQFRTLDGLQISCRIESHTFLPFSCQVFPPCTDILLITTV